MKKATRKTMQENENANVIEAINRFNNEEHIFLREERLRYCNARVLIYVDCTVLVSYNTIVALIENSNGSLYDFLRYVYGFTRTSAQHISKFAHDYRAQRRYTYRYV